MYFAGIICLLLLGVSLATSEYHKRNKLLYFMLDGFRYDYLKDVPREGTLGFHQFLSEGVKARWVVPVYPTLSYPSWTTLSTGLYPESHGILGNYFYDAEAKESFSLFDTEMTGKEKWWTAEPIWITATKAGIRTASIYWSRCDVEFDGVVPEYCEHFVQATGPAILKTNLEKALQKLQEGYEFVLLYNEYVDNVGHDSGPETKQRRDVIEEVDKSIVRLLTRLQELNLEDEVNVIIVSDHGMVDVAPGNVRRVELDQYLDEHLIENIADAGAYSLIKVKDENRVDEVYRSLKIMPGVDVYKHDDIPERLRIKNSKYVHEILLKAQIGTWMMYSSSQKQVPAKTDYVYFGAHGFDPAEEKMRSIFFAKGPDFKKNVTIDPINIVDIYGAVAQVLHLEPMPNNGTLEHVRPAFNKEFPISSAPRVLSIYIFTLFAALAVIVK